jgi:hypothetical protein
LLHDDPEGIVIIDNEKRSGFHTACGGIHEILLNNTILLIIFHCHGCNFFNRCDSLFDKLQARDPQWLHPAAHRFLPDRFLVHHGA